MFRTCLLEMFFRNGDALSGAGASFRGDAEGGEGRGLIFYRYRLGTGRLIWLAARRFRRSAQYLAQLALRVEPYLRRVGDRFFAEPLAPREGLGDSRPHCLSLMLNLGQLMPIRPEIRGYVADDYNGAIDECHRSNGAP